MTNAADMVDRIVAGVLEQLQTPGAAGAPATRSAAATQTLVIPEAVITAALLESRGIVAGPVVFAAKAVVTPSAIDYLSSKKIGWTRSGSAATSSNSAGATWSVLISRSTPAIEAALDAIARQPGIQWQRELVGCHREAARRAVGALCRGECDGVVAFTRKPEALACHANRNIKVRAAVVDSAERVKRAQRTTGANLFAIDPADESVFALRSLLRQIVAESKPTVPADWSE
jgi:hypothetical protein